MDILRHWTKIRYGDVTSYTEIIDQNIWYNSFIKNKRNHTLFCKEYYDRGILTMANIVLPNEKRFKTFAQIQEEYHVQNYIPYLSLIKAIPREWKTTIGKGIQDDNIENIVTLVKNRLDVTKKVYWRYIRSRQGNDAPYLVWARQLPECVTMDQWEKSRISCFKISLDTKLRYFQYRLLSCKLVTNSLRHRWDNTVSPLCYFCKEKEEVVMHILYECKIVKKLWSHVEKWLKYILKYPVDLSINDIILNNVTGKNGWFINTVILVTKQYIYATKCLKKELNARHVTQRVHNIYVIEKWIANSKDKSKKHEGKWQMYKKYVDV